MSFRPVLLALLFAAPALAAQAQANTPAGPVPASESGATPGGLAAAPRLAEPALDDLTRSGPESITLKLSATKALPIHDFDFNGDPVLAAKVHLRELAPGVFELTSLAYAPGIWRFHLTDQASIFGLGEHFDTLDHAHTIVRNAVIDPIADSIPRGSTTARPVPFFLSTTGYALALDVPPAADLQSASQPEATFDLNASDPTQITIDVSTTRLRILLFTGQPATPGRFPALLAQFLSTVPPSTPPAPAAPAGATLATQLTAALSDSLSGLAPAAIQIPSNPRDAPPPRFVELAALAGVPIACPNPAVDDILCKRYENLAATLESYRSAAFKFAEASRQPLLRALALDFQDDPEARECKDEFLLGSGLLAAPILDSNLSRPVYLPAGEWRNLLTGETITGPKTILVQAPLDTLPLFARPGATLPKGLAAAAANPAAKPAS